MNVRKIFVVPVMGRSRLEIFYSLWAPHAEYVGEPIIRRSILVDLQGQSEQVQGPRWIFENTDPLNYELILDYLDLPLEGEVEAQIFEVTYLPQGVEDHLIVLPGGPGGTTGVNHRRMMNHALRRILERMGVSFLDTVGTGLSRLLVQDAANRYYGVTQDANSLVQALQRLLTRRKLWGKRLWLMASSYGGTRMAALVRALMGGPTVGISPSGITSQIQGVIAVAPWFGRPDWETFHELVLPTMTRTALYHGAVVGDETLLSEVDDFLPQYAAALRRGNRLSEAMREQIAHQISRFTGLPEDLILAWNLRVSTEEFATRLLLRRQLRLGRYDGRMTAPLDLSLGNIDVVSGDPGMRASWPLIVEYRRFLQNLGVHIELPYEFIAIGVNGQWDYGPSGPARTDNVATYFAPFMAEDPSRRILLATGEYDLVVPSEVSENYLAHSGVSPNQVVLRRYGVGHTVTEDETFVDDLVTFIEGNMV